MKSICVISGKNSLPTRSPFLHLDSRSIFQSFNDFVGFPGGLAGPGLTRWSPPPPHFNGERVSEMDDVAARWMLSLRRVGDIHLGAPHLKFPKDMESF